MSYNEFLPSYSIGDDCYKEIPYVTRRYGKTAVVIGGKTAMEKAKPELLAALKGSDLEITDFIWYGGDSNYENIEMLKAMPEVQNADMVFGVGGGRAVDTVKTLCDRMDKPFFTFPTLASNCASCTAKECLKEVMTIISFMRDFLLSVTALSRVGYRLCTVATTSVHIALCLM